MSLWLLVSRDPLIFRDGKPFTANPGERAKSLAFPFPSTVAGSVRTLIGTNPKTGIFNLQPQQLEGLKKRIVRGPILVELSHTDTIQEMFFPAPMDALLVEEKGQQVFRYALLPFRAPQGAKTDLDDLNLIGPSKHVKEKPFLHAPLFWRWTEMQKWLKGEADGPIADPDSLGIIGAERESRSHVSIQPDVQVSREGALFQTSGMEFIRVKFDQENRMMDANSLALAVEIDEDADIKEGLFYLGGERRLAHWQRTQTILEKCPDTIKEKIIQQKHCRLILATPAYFEGGYLPANWTNDFGIIVQAVAVRRYQTVSGWDYETNTQKPTRRLAPAGSVYFLKFNEKTKEADIRIFIDSVWLKAISDDEQARNDGFGLALLGAWDGTVHEMEATK